MKRFLALVGLLLAHPVIAQPSTSSPGVVGMNVIVRFAFGIVSRNRQFLIGALATNAKGSLIDSTGSELRTDTREGPEAISTLIGNIPEWSGEITDAKCSPGVPGKHSCDFEVGQRDRVLTAIIDSDGDRVTSIVFFLGRDRKNG